MSDKLWRKASTQQRGEDEQPHGYLVFEEAPTRFKFSDSGMGKLAEYRGIGRVVHSAEIVRQVGFCSSETCAVALGKVGFQVGNFWVRQLAYQWWSASRSLVNQAKVSCLYELNKNSPTATSIAGKIHFPLR